MSIRAADRAVTLIPQKCGEHRQLNGLRGHRIMTNFILRLPAVRLRTGLSRSTIYLRIAQGTFPAPVSLGARAVGWVESEIDAWIARRIAESKRTSIVR